MAITIDWFIIELAFVLATALLGLLIGWKYMAIWTVGVFFAMLMSDGIGPRLGALLNRFISFGVGILTIAMGRADGSITPPTVTITSTTQPLWQSGFFLFLVAFAAWISRALGNAIAVGLLGKLIGAAFGALGTIVVLSKLSSYYQSYVANGGNDFLANSLNLGIPTISLGFGGTSGAADWAGLGTLAFALFLTLLVIYVIWRVVRVVL
jgi:hypothetical protein